MTLAESETTVDAFLGGKVEAVQPKHGHHRSGLEAVLLSAALPQDFDGTVVELGAGVGVAGMAIAARCSGAGVVLVERDAEAIACAREALTRPANRAFSGRVSIVATDIATPETERVAAGLGRAFADAVVMNPPFHQREEGTSSPNVARASRMCAAESGWSRGFAPLRPPSSRKAASSSSSAPIASTRFSPPSVAAEGQPARSCPSIPRAAEPAHRVLIAAVKGSRAGSRILPALVLHPEAGSTACPGG